MDLLCMYAGVLCNPKKKDKKRRFIYEYEGREPGVLIIQYFEMMVSQLFSMLGRIDCSTGL